MCGDVPPSGVIKSVSVCLRAANSASFHNLDKPSMSRTSRLRCSSESIRRTLVFSKGRDRASAKASRILFLSLLSVSPSAKMFSTYTNNIHKNFVQHGRKLTSEGWIYFPAAKIFKLLATASLAIQASHKEYIAWRRRLSSPENRSKGQ